MGPDRRSWLLIVASLALACKATPTTVLLEIRAGAGVVALEELRLTLLVAGDLPVKDRRLPPEGAPILPGEVVLYPPTESGSLRILARGLKAGAVAAEGTETVTLVAGAQTRATLTLQAGRLPDRDGDGIPDAVDSCPDLPNPGQGPCTSDARAEARRDAAVDARDGQLDLPPKPDLDCDRDKDGHLSVACGGNDCDDDRAAVHPGATEGAPGDPTCSDGLDNDCDGSKDLADTGCKSCGTDAECDDKNPCTADACVTGLCSNPPANEGTGCDDKNPCTTATVCKSGACGGGQAYVCPQPSNPCLQATCAPATGCVNGNRPDGTACNDGLFCTNPDSCTAGSCGGPPRDCTVGLLACHTRSCNEAIDQCVDSTLPDGTGCDDKDPCSQGESCKAGSCTAPALLNEVVASLGITDGGDRAMRVDPAGAVHVVFFETVSKKLTYATNKTGSWVLDTIAPATEIGPSLFLDAQGVPHVSFVDPAAGALKYAKRAGTSWTLATVIAPAKGPTSIAVSSAGVVHLVFTRGNSQELHHVSGPPWVPAQLDSFSANAYSLPTSIALDAQGKLHVAAGIGEAPFHLRYYTNATGSWVGSSPAASLGSHGLWPSLAIGASGNVYISHQPSDQTKAVVYLTTRTSAGWQTATVENVTGGTSSVSGRFTALALDSQEKVHIVYRNALMDLLRHVTNRSGAWVGQDLDTTGNNTGRWPSLARAPSGTIHLTYERDAAKELRHIAFSACP